MRQALSEWDAHAADPPGTLRPWSVGEELAGAVHDIWLRREAGQPWAFQLMIDDVQGQHWIFRRDHRITRPLSSLAGPSSTATCPVLAPEIQLLYKSKGLRPKDEQDFDAVLPALSDEQRRWLSGALAVVAPDHPWRSRLLFGA